MLGECVWPLNLSLLTRYARRNLARGVWCRLQCKPGYGLQARLQCCHPNCWLQHPTWLALYPALQVSVKGRSGAVSRSPRQPAALRCTALTTSHQRCWVAPVQGLPLPLKVTALEWAGLAFNWPVMVHRCAGSHGRQHEPRCKLRIEASARSQLKRQGR